MLVDIAESYLETQNYCYGCILSIIKIILLYFYFIISFSLLVRNLKI